jgi:hypothetical protein
MWGQISNNPLFEGLEGTVRMTQKNYMGWMEACVCCGTIRRAGHGLFCKQLLAWAGTSSSMQKCMVRQVLQGGYKQPISKAGPEGSGKRVQFNGA